jgi:hypothetical protein
LRASVKSRGAPPQCDRNQQRPATRVIGNVKREPGYQMPRNRRDAHSRNIRLNLRLSLTGIKLTVAAVALAWNGGGSASWHFVYMFLASGKPLLLAWLRSGSRAYQGLREVSIHWPGSRPGRQQSRLETR